VINNETSFRGASATPVRHPTKKSPLQAIFKRRVIDGTLTEQDA